ncbi:MAG: DnaD domain protein [Ruminococcaceae bacterium]|nr:DnaD domain protein [Oscillospiraceae bacterium]
MPYILKSAENDGIFGLPRDILPHLAGASESDLKVIIFLYSELKNGFDAENIHEIAEKLSLSDEEVNFSLAFWRGAGIIKSAKALKSKNSASEEQNTVVKKPGARPIYPAAQVAQAIENTTGMKALVDFCQHKFNKLFNPSQLSMLYSFYDNLGFEPDIIMLVAEHCCIIEKPSLGYMEKILITMSDNNITRYSDVEDYLGAKLRYNEQEHKLRKLCGFTSRELTPSEKKLIGVWFKEWSIDFCLVEKAYEITVDRISKPSLKYMNSILESWHQRGILNVSQLVETSSQKSEADSKSHDADEFFKAAVARSMGENT